MIQGRRQDLELQLFALLYLNKRFPPLIAGAGMKWKLQRKGGGVLKLEKERIEYYFGSLIDFWVILQHHQWTWIKTTF